MKCFAFRFVACDGLQNLNFLSYWEWGHLFTHKTSDDRDLTALIS